MMQFAEEKSTVSVYPASRSNLDASLGGGKASLRSYRQIYEMLKTFSSVASASDLSMEPAMQTSFAEKGYLGADVCACVRGGSKI